MTHATKVDIEDLLNNFQNQGCAAFSDEDYYMSVLWQNGKAKKYEIIRSSSGDNIALKFLNDLSRTGFENCMWHQLNNDGTWPSIHAAYNMLAEEVRLKIVQEQSDITASRLAKEAKEKEARDEEYRQRQELVQVVNTLVQTAKFRKAEYTLRGENESVVETVTGWSYRGIGIHKQVGKVSGPYKLTHISSGLSLGCRFASLTAAKTATVRIAHSVVGDFGKLSVTEIAANQTTRTLVRAIANVNDPYVNVDVQVSERGEK